MAPKLVSIVVPMFNEAPNIAALVAELNNQLPSNFKYELIFVDDGSSDDSVEVARKADFPSVKVVQLVANAGHMAALDAGYRASKGDWVVTLDADLQHPPAIIPELLATAEREKVEIVYAVRGKRTEDSLFKRSSARLFYKAMRSLSEVDLQNSAADFRLVSKRVVDVIKSLPKGRVVFRIFIPSLGFPSASVPYTVAPRFAGESKYTLARMIRLSTNSLLTSTTKPLILGIRIGVVTAILSFVGVVSVVVNYFIGHRIEGWTSMMAVMLGMFAVLFVLVGVIGSYLAIVVKETLRQPTYVLGEIHE
jgi:dolichol-phosphate mannosyltransferase